MTWNRLLPAMLLVMALPAVALADVTVLTMTAETDVPIPDDNSSVFSSIEVDVPSLVMSVEVYVDIEHPAAEQLLVRLIAPQPWQTMLAFMGGGQLAGSDPVGWFPTDFSTYHDLGDLVDGITEGTWYLECAVAVGGSPGTLREWRLRLTYDDSVPVSATRWSEVKRLFR